MLDKMSKRLLGEKSQNEIVVLKMYLLTQSGYKMRIAKCNGNLALLMPTKEEIYGYSYLEFDNQRFYVLNKGLNGSFEVFKLEFPKEQLASMQMNNIPTFTESKMEKKMMIEGTVEIQGTVQVDKANEIESLLKRVFMFLEEGDWSNADNYCEKVLDIDPENAEAYLGKLMVEYELNYIEQFTDLDSSQYPINFPKKILPDVEESKNFSKMRI